MTRIERQTAEAVIDLLAAVGFLVGNGAAASGLRVHRLVLSAALAADPAPAACDPYARSPIEQDRHTEAMHRISPQYDAEAPE